MKIAIAGAGHVGTAIARGLNGKGHEVILGVRDAASPAARQSAADSGASLDAPAAAAAAADLVILALPWAVAEMAIGSLGPLDGKVVIDCMNPIGMANGAMGLTLGHSTSGGERVQDWLPAAKVVKTLNQVGAEMVADNSHLPHRPVQFMAGNDDGAKQLASRLLEDLGFEPLDAGDITKSRFLEPLAMVWINQAMFRGKGRTWALAAVS